MLQRVLEPEVMDTSEEARDYDAMDHQAVNKAFIADFLAVWNGRSPLLDLGTGTAQIPIELCRQAPTARVVAIDLAEEMLRVARLNVKRTHLQDQIQLQACDAKKLPFPDGTFAAVISNSIIHHIPEPKIVLAQMVRVTEPNGDLFIRDLLRPADEANLIHLVKTHAGGANEHQRKMFCDSLKAALTLAEIRDLVAGLGFDASQVKHTTDRHWTWQAHKPASPTQ
jgi:ubiquinone/menaquinone biosynthesis C-methylase UbiE